MEPVLPPPEPLTAYVQRARALYTLPAVALQVLELTDSPRVDARALKHCIENDPALVARLLRVVNSSLFGLSRQVSDLNQALALLGVAPLKLLVLGFCMPQGLFIGLRAEMLSAWWRRTLVKAAAARAVHEAAGDRHGDEAFLAGLLQDLGQLALAQDLGDSYLAFVERARREAGDLAVRELETLGFDHAMFSARLLDQWRLPQELVRAVAQRQEIEHLATLPDPACRLPQTLHLAELTARLLADEQPTALGELQAAAWRYKNLAPQQMENLLRSLRETTTALAEALDVEGYEPIDCDRLLAQAQAQRAAITSAAEEELKLAIAETRLWREAEALRHAAADFLTRQAGAAQDAVSPSATRDRSPREPTSVSRNVRPTCVGKPAAPSHFPPLTAQVAMVVANARKRRAPVSLLAVRRDHERDGAQLVGAEARQRIQRLIATAAESLSGPNGVCVECDAMTTAVVLEDCDRLQAVALAREMVETVARCAAAREAWFGGPVTVSIGAATLALPPHNFPCQELIDAAWRCLYGAQAAGGNGAKSIDI